MDNIIITPEITKAMDLINNTDKNILISGRAGTGKSCFLQYFLKNIGEKKAVILAPTGIAAINVDGQTIHRFFKLDFNIQDVYNESYYNRILSQIKSVLKEVDFLVIDEISMVRADIFDSIQHLINIVDKNIRVVALGDLKQLAPVLRKEDKDEYYNKFGYMGVHFYQAKRWDLDTWEKVEFETIFRQKDPELKRHLNIIRDKKVDLRDSLYYFNKRISNNDDGVMICTRVKQVEEVNEKRLNQLNEKEIVYNAKIYGVFPKSSYPTDERLVLKVGARVMCTKNNVEACYVNGTMGTIIKANQDVVIVRTDDDGLIDIKRESWVNKEHTLDENGKFVSLKIGEFKQFPLKVAYAVTVHKSQGKTFNKITVDRGYGFFEPGQLYVALSRCKTYEGITIKKPLLLSDVK